MSFLERGIFRLILHSKIRNRLFLSSIILTILIIVSLYFLSESLLSHLIIERQADYELSSFKQTENYIKSVFENVEGRIQRIFRNSKITRALTVSFNYNDLYYIFSTKRELDNELDNIFFEVSHIENIILLGRNNYNHVYTPLTTGVYLDNDLNFEYFLHQSDLSPYFAKPDAPFYYKKDNTGANNHGSVEKKLYDLINNKVMLIRTLNNKNGVVDGIIIITFKNSFFTNILGSSVSHQSLYLVDSRQTVIWASDSRNTHFTSSILKHPGDTGYFRTHIQNRDYLIAYDTLLQQKLRLISSTPLSSILKQKYEWRLMTIGYGVFCLLFVLLISYFFATFITTPLGNLARNITNENAAIPQPLATELRSPLYKFSLRKKMILYYLLGVIIPNLIYISLLAYYNYSAYNQKITEYTVATIELAKGNINYRLKNINDITEQFIFDRAVQNAMYRKTPGAPALDFSFNLEKVFLNTKSTAKEFLSFDLYNLPGENIYSGLYFENLQVADKYKNFFGQLQKSGNRLISLGAAKDLSTNPILYFARNVRSIDFSFGSYIGYAVFTLDQDFLNKIIQKIKVETSGYFFLMDQNGIILSHDSEELTAALLNNPKSRLKLQKPSGSYNLTIGGKDYLVFYDTSDRMGFKIVGVVPLQEIKTRVYPILWYNLVFLFLALIFIFAVATFISSSITSPIQNLQSFMNEVSKENSLTPVDYRGKDEVAVLTGHFNNMIARLNKLVHENYQSKLRESQLMFLEKEAQLNALRQQINPHFLYNTLESIKWMAYKKGVFEICDMATALGKFFRWSITGGGDFVTIGEEIEHLKNYLYIQKVRFQDKFAVRWEISAEILRYVTLKLTLQPLVENAVIHGVESMEEGAVITMRGYIAGSRIHFEIEDNGIGMTEAQLRELKRKLTAPEQNDSRASIGITNVYQRLRLYFGATFSFDIESEAGRGIIVKLSIPKISQKDD